MIRTAASLRASLSQPVIGTLWHSQHGFALFVRRCLLAQRSEYDTTFAARCRSVREQQRYESRDTDGTPPWL